MAKKNSQGTTETMNLMLKIVDGRAILNNWAMQVEVPITANVAERDLILVERAAAILKDALPAIRAEAKSSSAEDKVKQAKLADIEATLRRMALPEGHITRTIKRLKGLPLDSPEWRTFTTLNPAYAAGQAVAKGETGQ